MIYPSADLCISRLNKFANCAFDLQMYKVLHIQTYLIVSPRWSSSLSATCRSTSCRGSTRRSYWSTAAGRAPGLTRTLHTTTCPLGTPTCPPGIQTCPLAPTACHTRGDSCEGCTAVADTSEQQTISAPLMDVQH